MRTSFLPIVIHHRIFEYLIRFCIRKADLREIYISEVYALALKDLVQYNHQLEYLFQNGH